MKKNGFLLSPSLGSEFHTRNVTILLQFSTTEFISVKNKFSFKKTEEGEAMKRSDFRSGKRKRGALFITVCLQSKRHQPCLHRAR